MLRVLVPSLKVTLPVGVAVLDVTLTWAVNVMDAPKVDGLRGEVKLIFVLNLTVCVKAAEVLVAKLLSPL